MTSEESIGFTVDIFVNLLRENTLRLQRAEQRRAVALAGLEQGQENYRIIWIKDSVGRVLDCLESIARDFNQSNPTEVATLHDFGDILQSTIRTIVAQNG